MAEKDLEHGHCPQCDKPDCSRHGECQTLDISRIPREVDFIIYSVNGHVGGTPFVRIGEVEFYGDTVQSSIDGAVEQFRKARLDG